MKKFVLIMILALGWLNSYCQVEAVFPYNHPTMEKLYKLATSKSKKGVADGQFLLTRVNLALRDTSYKISSIDEIFLHLHLEDVTLVAGTYINSGYDTVKKVMARSIGNDWSGFSWVYRIGSFSVVLIKGDCGNILTCAPVRTTPTFTQHNIPPPDQFTEQRVPTRIPSFTETAVPVMKDSVVVSKGISTLGWVGIGVGTAAVAYLGYELLHKKDAGTPGGTPANQGGPGGTPANQGLAKPIGPTLGAFGFGIGFTNYQSIKSNGQISIKHSFGLSATFSF